MSMKLTMCLSMIAGELTFRSDQFVPPDLIVELSREDEEARRLVTAYLHEPCDETLGEAVNYLNGVM
jgi:hypothetical protein